jgi:hypothetical protein
MRNALNKLADTVTNPEEKKVRTPHPLHIQTQSRASCGKAPAGTLCHDERRMSLSENG